MNLILSDMAPNISGITVSDQSAASYLTELSLDFAKHHGETGSVLLTKCFMGEGFDAILRQARQSYETVKICKPAASRRTSREVYLLARGLKAGHE